MCNSTVTQCSSRPHQSGKKGEHTWTRTAAGVTKQGTKLLPRLPCNVNYVGTVLCTSKQNRYCMIEKKNYNFLLNCMTYFCNHWSQICNYTVQGLENMKNLKIHVCNMYNIRWALKKLKQPANSIPPAWKHEQVHDHHDRPGHGGNLGHVLLLSPGLQHPLDQPAFSPQPSSLGRTSFVSASLNWKKHKTEMHITDGIAWRWPSDVGTKYHCDNRISDNLIVLRSQDIQLYTIILKQSDHDILPTVRHFHAQSP